MTDIAAATQARHRPQLHGQQANAIDVRMRNLLSSIPARPRSPCGMPAVGELVRCTNGAWMVRPPLRCPRGHRLRPGHTIVGTIACSCGRHLTWRYRVRRGHLPAGAVRRVQLAARASARAVGAGRARLPWLMAQIARGHHTVPRFYLDRFANDGQQIGVVRLPGDIRYGRSTEMCRWSRTSTTSTTVPNLIAEIEGDAAAVSPATETGDGPFIVSALRR